MWRRVRVIGLVGALGVASIFLAYKAFIPDKAADPSQVPIRIVGNG